MNRFTKAWVPKVSLPFTCPICLKSVGGRIGQPLSAEKLPLIVQRVVKGVASEVMLHVGCQAACTAVELRSIRRR